MNSPPQDKSSFDEETYFELEGLLGSPTNKARNNIDDQVVCRLTREKEELSRRLFIWKVLAINLVILLGCLTSGIIKINFESDALFGTKSRNNHLGKTTNHTSAVNATILHTANSTPCRAKNMFDSMVPSNETNGITDPNVMQDRNGNGALTSTSFPSDKKENVAMNVEKDVENRADFGVVGVADIKTTIKIEDEDENELDNSSMPASTETIVTSTDDNFHDDINEDPHVVYTDLRYRRVCAPVGVASILCMTIRFSFPVPFQNPSLRYPSPIAHEFYNLTRKSARFIDGEELDQCRMATEGMSMDDAVKKCLDDAAAAYADVEGPNMVMIFTRARKGRPTIFFGTGSEGQRKNLHEYFDGHVIQVLGDSTGPGVTNCISQLFGDCIYSPIEGQASMYCGKLNEAERKRYLRSGGVPFEDMDESYSIWIGIDAYYPPGKNDHDLPKNLTATLQNLGKHRKKPANLMSLSSSTNWPLRPMSVIISYPFAHFQNQLQMLNNYEKVKYLQSQYPKLVMSVKSEVGEAEMAELGFELGHLIVYDGLPQYFPSETSGWLPALSAYHNESQFLAHNGYEAIENSPAWTPQVGSTCRGPVPPNSLMTNVSRISRDAFASADSSLFDMKYYLRNWEFSNQLWWMMHFYGRKGLDCTHGEGDYYCIHKYLLQAMVDDHYENV